MRLYSRDGATAVSHGGVTYTAGSDGGFDFPEETGRHLHAFHAGKRPLWETDIERQNREAAEIAERRKDPATLLDAVQQIIGLAQGAPVAEAPKAPRSRKPSAEPAAE